jgi:hypothetical protein
MYEQWFGIVSALGLRYSCDKTLESDGEGKGTDVAILGMFGNDAHRRMWWLVKNVGGWLWRHDA